MNNLTNTDLQRDFGRMEGHLEGMDDRLIPSGTNSNVIVGSGY